MKERPILFSGGMVRGILKGIKDRTRRTKGLEKINKNPDFFKLVKCTNGSAEFIGQDGNTITVKCPYGVPGDRLWIRETYRPYINTLEENCIQYRANNMVLPVAEFPNDHHGLNVAFNFAAQCEQYWDSATGKNSSPWKPSIFMRREYSRILLEIVDIRVEFLFIGLWDFINAKRGYSWDDNPYVWVIEFRRVS